MKTEGAKSQTGYRPTLAIVLITHDVAHTLPATLESVGFGDSIIVMDSGSVDITQEVAEQYGARVIVQREWQGYGYQKNLALTYAKDDWILFLDADEVVDEILAGEIQRVTQELSSVSGYSMKRVNYFCDEPLRYGSSRPKFIPRLFQRGKGRVSDHRVHEVVVVDGIVEPLAGELHHYTTESITHRIIKNDNYTTTMAKDWFDEGRRVSIVQLVFIVPLVIVRELLLKAGILDGRKGIVAAGLVAFYAFSKYAKLWELCRKWEKGESVVTDESTTPPAIRHIQT